jgi:uncharacterized integral membrane protein
MGKSGIGLIGLGALLLILAAFANVYQVKTGGTTTRTTLPGGWYDVTSPIVITKPYKDYTLPLCLGAVACFVMGFAIMAYEQLNKQKGTSKES